MFKNTTEFFKKIPSQLTGKQIDLLGKDGAGIYEIILKSKENLQWIIKIEASGKVTTAINGLENPDIILTMKETDFLDLVNRKIRPAQAFFSGKIKISGNKNLIIKLQKILSRKYW